MLILFYHLTKNQFVFNISVIYVVFFRRGGGVFDALFFHSYFYASKGPLFYFKCFVSKNEWFAVSCVNCFLVY